MPERKIPILDNHNFNKNKPIFNSSYQSTDKKVIEITSKKEAGKDFKIGDRIIYENDQINDYDIVLIKFKQAFHKRRIIHNKNLIHFKSEDKLSKEIIIENELLDEILIGKFKQLLRSLENDSI